jgi:hypothetical protein
LISPVYSEHSDVVVSASITDRSVTTTTTPISCKSFLPQFAYGECFQFQTSPDSSDQDECYIDQTKEQHSIVNRKKESGSPATVSVTRSEYQTEDIRAPSSSADKYNNILQSNSHSHSIDVSMQFYCSESNRTPTSYGHPTTPPAKRRSQFFKPVCYTIFEESDEKEAKTSLGAAHTRNVSEDNFNSNDNDTVRPPTDFERKRQNSHDSKVSIVEDEKSSQAATASSQIRTNSNNGNNSANDNKSNVFGSQHHFPPRPTKQQQSEDPNEAEQPHHNDSSAIFLRNGVLCERSGVKSRSNSGTLQTKENATGTTVLPVSCETRSAHVNDVHLSTCTATREDRSKYAQITVYDLEKKSSYQISSNWVLEWMTSSLDWVEKYTDPLTDVLRLVERNPGKGLSEMIDKMPTISKLIVETIHDWVYNRGKIWTGFSTASSSEMTTSKERWQKIPIQEKVNKSPTATKLIVETIHDWVYNRGRLS